MYSRVCVVPPPAAPSEWIGTDACRIVNCYREFIFRYFIRIYQNITFPLEIIRWSFSNLVLQFSHIRHVYDRVLKLCVFFLYIMYYVCTLYMSENSKIGILSFRHYLYVYTNRKVPYHLSTFWHFFPVPEANSKAKITLLPRYFEIFMFIFTFDTLPIP